MPFKRPPQNDNHESQPFRPGRYFIGRETEQSFFREKILAPRYPEVNIVGISGDGGIGKSTLLDRYVRFANEDEYRDQCRIARVEEQPTPYTIMKRFAEQLQAGAHSRPALMPKFDEAITKYEKDLERLRDERGGGRDNFLHKTYDFAGAGFLADHVMEYYSAPDPSSKDREYQRRLWHAHQVVRDTERKDDPIRDLTRAFVQDLNRLSEPPHDTKILLFFDTFEQVGSEVAPWLLNIFLQEELSQQIVLIIAGRDKLTTGSHGSKWGEFGDNLQEFALKFFSLDETRDYLAKIEITDETEIARIHELSGGLPFYLDLFASNPQHDTNPTKDVIERFLKWIPADRTMHRRIAQEAAFFTQPFNLDDLAAFDYIPEQKRAQIYDWLIQQPFVKFKEQPRGYLYHDMGREQFTRYIYTRSHEEYYHVRKRLAVYYQNKFEELERRTGEHIRKTRDWQDLAFACIEQLFFIPEDAARVKALELVMYYYRYADKLQEEEIYTLLDTYQNAKEKLPGVSHFTKQLVFNLHQFYKEDFGTEKLYQASEFLLTYLSKFENFPSDFMARFYGRYGYNFSIMDKFDKALETLDRAIELDKNYGWALVRRGQIYRKKEEYDLAIFDFTKAIELDEDYGWPIAQRGETYRLKGDYNSAIADFTKAIELDLNYKWAIASRGQTYKSIEEYDLAIADFTRAIELDPNSGWKIAQRGETYHLKGEYDLAIFDFTRAIELDPEDDWAIASRGQTYTTRQEYDLAITDFTRAIELDPNYAWPIAERGEAYRLKEEYDLAITDFTRAIELDPNYAWAIANRGKTYRSKGDYDLAITDFTRAIELNPNYVLTIVASRGQVYRSKGEHDLAVLDFTKVIELNPSGDLALAERGEINRLKGEYDLAIADFTKAIEINPDYVWVIAHRAETYRLKGEYDLAIADFTKAIEIDLNYSWAVATRGLT